MRKINIAIDGPSAAGKSTIAKNLAKKLAYIHLDTGAMYRCVAYKANQEGLSWEDEPALVDMIANTKIQLTPEGEVFLDDKEISQTIRSNQISLGASKVSTHPRVRAALVAQQQRLAKDKGVIMDGRDIGTVVLVDAEVKIFLTASAEARAQRRCLENASKGIESDLKKITEEIKERDYSDSHRLASPLKKAVDAIEVDSSNLSIEEVCQTIEKIVERKISE